mmetsp:Transcript_27967/g.39388  ORF Transcript_27967/g.39388 Transcript_27967/m.39388 type:complete len:258 (+) Transcript_27967:49-822(+)
MIISTNTVSGLAVLLVSCFMNQAHGFTNNVLHHNSLFGTFHKKQQHPFHLNAGSGPTSLEDLLSNEKMWEPLKTELDAVPVFCCANEQGQPMQYNMGAGNVAFFFCDIDYAKDELEKAKKDTGLDTLGLAPVPLGQAFEMACRQQAVIIPSEKSLKAAGAPEGINPVGQQIPLFGCDDIAQKRTDGTSFTPLFIDNADAEKIIQQAADMATEDGPDLEMKILPLVQAVRMVATNEEDYTFVPPEKSMNYLRMLNGLE